MDSIIETPRLRLTRMTDTDINSEHVQWFHKLSSDESFTAWSIKGTSTSKEQSQSWLVDNLVHPDTGRYAIHIKSTTSEPDVLAGSVGLRIEPHAPELPPPPRPSTSSQNSTSEGDDTPINYRTIGYGLVESARGKGYMSEAASALIAAFAAHRARDFPGEVNYIEAGIGVENKESIKLARRLGFERVGFVETKAFSRPDHPLGKGLGKWWETGYDVYGLYV